MHPSAQALTPAQQQEVDAIKRQARFQLNRPPLEIAGPGGRSAWQPALSSHERERWLAWLQLTDREIWKQSRAEGGMMP